MQLDEEIRKSLRKRTMLENLYTFGELMLPEDPVLREVAIRQFHRLKYCERVAMLAAVDLNFLMFLVGFGFPVLWLGIIVATAFLVYEVRAILQNDVKYQWIKFLCDDKHGPHWIKV